MANIFSGLESLGFKNTDKIDVFNEEEKESKKEEAKKSEPPKEAIEETLLFDKSYTCPVCNNEFKSKILRTGKVRLVGQDSDLRPTYQHVDALKYDAVMCPHCGFASLSRYFSYVGAAQVKAIKENVSRNFTNTAEDGKVYTYDDAILRHKMALLCTVVKKGKSSEKAYTCLKLAWLYRGKRELLMTDENALNAEISELQEEENELLKNAFEGFEDAMINEDFPMCGMDMNTMCYLLAELARRTGNIDASKRYVSKVLTARDANSRLKDKAMDLKEKLRS